MTNLFRSRMLANPMDRRKANRLVLGLGMLVLPLLLIQLAAVIGQPMYFGHDENEHLSAMFALERGERPYLDFFENHPLLPHVLLSWLHRWLGMNDVGQIYALAMSLVLLHVVGCCVVLFWFARRFARTASLPWPPAALMWVALGLLTPWQDDLRLVWQLRPDWICYFWAMLGVFLHWRLLERWYHGVSISPVLWVAGGAASGWAMALLPKAVFFFLPYGMLLLILLIVDAAPLIDAVRLRQRTFITVNLGFALVALIVWMAGVAVELQVTGASFEAYYKANVTLNTLRHPVSTFEEVKLFDLLASASAGHLLIVLTGLLLIAVQFLRLARGDANDKFALYSVLGIVLVVVVNGLLPAFSNGGQWSQYYTPALMMFYLLTVVALAEGWQQLDRLTTGWRLRRMVLGGVGLVFALLFVGALGTRYAEALARVENKNLTHQLLAISSGTDSGGALPDRLLPPNLSYLSFDPVRRPVRGKFWGYYFMLAADHGMWQDTYRLHLGPDPATHWQDLWRRQPPDVVLVSSAMDLQNRVGLVKAAHQVDIAWLKAAMRQDYMCRTRSGLAVYVHHQASTAFSGWRPCTGIDDE